MHHATLCRNSKDQSILERIGAIMSWHRYLAEEVLPVRNKTIAKRCFNRGRIQGALHTAEFRI